MLRALLQIIRAERLRLSTHQAPPSSISISSGRRALPFDPTPELEPHLSAINVSVFLRRADKDTSFRPSAADSADRKQQPIPTPLGSDTIAFEDTSTKVGKLGRVMEIPGEDHELLITILAYFFPLGHAIDHHRSEPIEGFEIPLN